MNDKISNKNDFPKSKTEFKVNNRTFIEEISNINIKNGKECTTPSNISNETALCPSTNVSYLDHKNKLNINQSNGISSNLSDSKNFTKKLDFNSFLIKDEVEEKLCDRNSKSSYCCEKLNNGMIYYDTSYIKDSKSLIQSKNDKNEKIIDSIFKSISKDNKSCILVENFLSNIKESNEKSFKIESEKKDILSKNNERNIIKPEKINEMSNKLETKMKQYKEKRSELIEKERIKIKKSLVETGYMVDEISFKKSKEKVKNISIYRQPFHKEFPSAKGSDVLFSTLNEFEAYNLCKNNNDKDFTILKKRKLSRSASKIYTSDIILTDTTYPYFKRVFKIYQDEDIGITPQVQVEMIESVIFYYRNTMKMLNQVKK